MVRVKKGWACTPHPHQPGLIFHHEGMYAKNRQLPLCVYSVLETSCSDHWYDQWANYVHNDPMCTCDNKLVITQLPFAYTTRPYAMYACVRKVHSVTPTRCCTVYIRLKVIVMYTVQRDSKCVRCSTVLPYAYKTHHSVVNTGDLVYTCVRMHNCTFRPTKACCYILYSPVIHLISVICKIFSSCSYSPFLIYYVIVIEFCNSTLLKKIGKFVRDRVRSHNIWLTASSSITKYSHISSYICTNLWISLYCTYLRKFFQFLLTVYGLVLLPAYIYGETLLEVGQILPMF
jgi:hypothetical protein